MSAKSQAKVEAKAKKSELIPATILTGYLGSGKTTLLKRILTERHGEKIAVIENEFGEEGIDNDILVQEKDEQIIEMNNGCICCTVRGDLIRIITNLMRRRDKFDHLVIETTGLADPAPVIHLKDFFIRIDHQFMIDANFTKFINDDRDFFAMFIGEDAIEQSSFACTKITC